MQEKDFFKDKTATAERPKFSLPPPPLALHAADGDASSPAGAAAPASAPALPALRYFDSACHLSSRQFDSTLQSVVRRASAADVQCMLVTTPDFSRAEEVLQLVRGYPGLLYCSLGVSPDLIKKNADKLFESRMQQLNDLALQSEVVNISAGLDLTRDVSTHFLQTRLFASQVDLAIRIRLPLVVHEKAAADKVIEAIHSAHAAAKSAADADDEQPPLRVAIHAFNGSDEQLASFVREGYMLMVNGTVCDLKVAATGADAAAPSSSSVSALSSSSTSALLPELSGDGASLFRQLRAGLLPVSRLLLCSDSPLHTPNNILDVHQRSQRNEPSNLPFVYQVVAKALRMPTPTLVDHIDRNTRSFFQLSYAHDKQAAAVEESKEERKEPIAQPAATQGGKKAQKAKVAFAAEVKGGAEAEGDKQDSMDDVTRQLQQQRIDEDENEEDGEEEGEDEDEEDDGEEEAPSGAQERRQAKQAPTEDESEEEDEEEEEEETEESGEEERRPLSSSSPDVSSKTKPKAASAAAAASLVPAGRRRNAKQADDDADDDDWDTSKAKKKNNPKQKLAKPAQPKPTPTHTFSNGEDDDDDGEAAVEATPRRVGSSKKAASASSRQRVIGSDVNLSLDRDMVRYACKRCRTILFTEDDLVPHRSQQSVAGVQGVGQGGEGVKGKKGAIEEWDRTQCQNLFVRPMVWMSNLQLSVAGGSSSSSSTSAVLTTSDRIECGECGYKLGRCGMVALYLPCSCGRQCDGPPPYFSISLSRVDPLEHSALLKAPRAAEAQFAAQRAEAESEQAARSKERKAAQKAKEGKRTKRQQKEDQRGNFTSDTPPILPLLLSAVAIVAPVSPAPALFHPVCCAAVLSVCAAATSATRTQCAPRARRSEKRGMPHPLTPVPAPPATPPTHPSNKLSPPPCQDASNASCNPGGSMNAEQQQHTQCMKAS